MNAWTSFGPHALMIKHKAKIDRVTKAYEALWNTLTGEGMTEELWKEIDDIRVKTGLTLGVGHNEVTITYRFGRIYKNETLETDTATVVGQQESIRLIAQLNQWSLDRLRTSFDDFLMPDTDKDLERVTFEIANAMERKNAFIRNALKRLSSTASYVMLIDPLVVASETKAMIGQSRADRIKAFRDKISTKNIPYDMIKIEGTRRIGNLLLSHNGPYRQHEGMIHTNETIPQAIKTGMVGKPLEALLDGHPAQGMGVTIEMITTEDDLTTIHTSAKNEASLIPVDLYQE